MKLKEKKDSIYFNGKEYICPVELVIDVISGKWKLLILKHLMGGKKRFSELQKSIPGITQKMLTKQLRELEKAGLVERKVYPVVPPKVEYSLTPMGKNLEKLFNYMHEWGLEYIKWLKESHKE